LPAAGQGALGIETCAERADLRTWLAPLVDASTTACVKAERAVSRRLGGSCEVPLAAYATERAGMLHLQALVGRQDGSTILRVDGEAPAAAAEALGEQLAERLIAQGALTLLQAA
jgi:hydroxymethylbilane synthase